MRVPVVAQIDVLVLHAAPEAPDERVVQLPSPPVHADLDVCPRKNPGEFPAGELAAVSVLKMRVACSHPKPRHPPCLASSGEFHGGGLVEVLGGDLGVGAAAAG